MIVYMCVTGSGVPVVTVYMCVTGSGVPVVIVYIYCV